MADENVGTVYGECTVTNITNPSASSGIDPNVFLVHDHQSTPAPTLPPSNDPTVAKKSKASRANKLCKICGDKAIGFNFGVISCESCKAFFRRNYGREDFSCPFYGRCKVNIRSRKHCPKCRLDKCLDVGMKFVEMSRHLDDGDYEEEEDEYPYENANSGISKVVVDDPDEPGPDDGVVVTIRLPKGSGMGLGGGGGGGQELDAKELGKTIVDALMAANARGRTMASATVGHSPNETADQQSGEQQTGELVPISQGLRIAMPPRLMCPTYPAPRNYESAHSLAVAEKVMKRVCAPLDAGRQTSFIAPPPLSMEVKYVKLQELVMANDLYKSTAKPSGKCTCDPNINAREFNRMSYLVYKGLIKQHSTLKAFKKFSLEDQARLLQNRIHDILLIRVICKYNPQTGRSEEDSWSLSLELTQRMASPIPDLYCKVTNLVKSYPDQFRSNETLMLILGVLALFNPDGQVDRNAVEFERQIYLQVLKDYLISTYGDREARWYHEYFVGWINYVGLWHKNYAPRSQLQLDPQSLELTYFDSTHFFR